MATTPQTRALKNYRSRLTQRGMARFEVLGLATDRQLIRTLARKLVETSPASDELRTSILRKISAQPQQKGGILRALLRSPLVGAEIDSMRPRISARKVDL
jgi:hypothetical protein